MKSEVRKRVKPAEQSVGAIDKTALIKGVVQGSRKSFGFLVSEDDERYFISPPSMKQLINGDTILASIKTISGRNEVVVQHVLESNIGSFYGVARVRRGCHWIEIESPFISNWMKISNPEGINDGDWVFAKVGCHPFDVEDGSAEVIDIVAKSGDKLMPWLLAKHRYDISDEETDELESLDCNNDYEDMTHIPFITIDSEHTVDIDDALYAEKTDSGMNLYIAIADVGSWIRPGCKADFIAKSKGATAYLLNDNHPMLPRKMVEEKLSLSEDRLVGATVCTLSIDGSGDVSNIKFKMANIVSRAKLSYVAVDQYLDAGIDLGFGEGVKNVVDSISSAAMTLRYAREMDAVVPNYGGDTRMIISDGEIVDFSSFPRNIAHIIVEECMVVANRSFAAYCQENSLGCLYRVQRGFKADKKQEAVAILNHWGIIDHGDNIDDPIIFSGVMRAIELDEYSVPEILIRPMIDKGSYSITPGLHMALGLPIYATFTSPIRRYSDLVNQRIMRDSLLGELPETLTSSDAIQIDLLSRKPIMAAREVEKHLKARYFRNNKDRECSGFVSCINSGGMRVVDSSSGASAFIVMRDLIDHGETPRVHAFGSELWVSSDSSGDAGFSDMLKFRVGESVTFKVSFVDQVSGEMQAFLI